MINSLFKKGIMTALVVMFGLSSTFAQTFWSYDFGDEAQSGMDWTAGGTNTGAVQWAWTNDPIAGAYSPEPFAAPTATNGHMWFDSDGNAANDHDVTLTTANAIDCTDKNDVRVRFYGYLRSFTGGETASVSVSTDGMTFVEKSIPEFDALPAETAGNPSIAHDWVEVDLDEADGAAQVWIRFRYAGNYEYYFKIDDVEVMEYQVPVSPIAFTVDMSNETVDAAGMFLAGSFNNWTDEAMNDNGDGTWSLTKDLNPGDVQFKFKNGPNGWESGDLEACGSDDGNGGFNRAYTVGDMGAAYGPFCFNSCEECVVPAIPCDMNPMALLCDNFDTYDPATAIGTQAAHWTTWSDVPGNFEDGFVTTAQAASGANSLQITDGGQDLLLNLGNLSSGHVSYKHSLYIPTGNAAYYNIQDAVPLGATGIWNADLDFAADGTGTISVTQVAQASFNYPMDTWFVVEHVIDLDNDLASLYVDGVFVNKMAFAGNLGGLNFYSIDASYQYNVDDVELVSLPAVVYNVDACDGAVDITPLFGAAPGVANVSAIQSNVNATTDAATDVAGSCWGESSVTNSMWYTFTGDGNQYSIQTTPCNVVDSMYINDTQMAIFTGDCGNMTEVGCADDLFTDGMPDWRAGLNFETEAGVDYSVLIDGFNYNGVVAVGDYCIEVEQISSVDCAAGAVGSSVVSNNGFVCLNQSTASVLEIPNPDEFIIPNIGPVFGMVWVISTEPLDGSVWPADAAGYWGSFGISPTVGVQGIVNDGDPLAAGIWYWTPVVVAGGVDATPTTPAFMHEVDITNGCYFVGTSQQLALLPALDPLDATAVVVDDNGTGVGGLDVTTTGGFAPLAGQDTYTYEWDNGATTEDIAGLSDGSYTVTVSDITGCVDAGIFTFMVGTVSAQDPANVLGLTIAPNPTNGWANVNINLENAADVRIEMVNTIGQVVMTQDAGKVQTANLPMDFSNLSSGVYMMRLTIAGQTAIRTIAVNR